MDNQLTNITPNTANWLIQAPEAVITVLNTATGGRYTFKCTAKETATWVYVLSGPNNASDYTYIGSISFLYRIKHFKPAKNAKITPAMEAFIWLWKRLNSAPPSLPENVKLYHSGNCFRCGRRLTTPESIACGIGPICRQMS